MRRLAICFILLGPICSAHAADMSDDYGVLRGTSTFDPPSDSLSGPSFVPGTPAYTDWSGVYVGVSAGYTSSNFNFETASKQLVAKALQQTTVDSVLDVQDWKIFGNSSTSGSSYGIFGGYNWQWEDAVLGVEFSYGRSEASGIASVLPLGRSKTVGTVTYDVDLNGSASMKVKETGGVRARAGWSFGNFMPYMTAGLAVGRADANRAVTVSDIETDTSTAPATVRGATYTQSESRSDAFIYGYSVGAGVDMMLLPNLFVRGEVEYMNFAPLLGIKADTINARVGAGLKY